MAYNPVATARGAERVFRTGYISTRTNAQGALAASGSPGEYLMFARRRDELAPLLDREFFEDQDPDAQRITL